MSSETPFARLERELEAAAARQISPARRRRWWRRHTVALFGIALGVGAGAAAWAATSLLSSGAPVPFVRGAPIAGRAQGAPIPGTVKLLVGDVADPAGGVPWGLRYWETDRKYACVQVGRVWEGKLGQISGGKVFHELRLGVTNGALGGCFLLDGSGHAFTAIHSDAQPGAQPQPCPTGFRVGTALRGPHGSTVRCPAPRRTIDFGLLGPNATSFTYRAAGREHTARPLGGVGAFLVVQQHIKPVMREFGFHHKDPKLNLSGPAEPYLSLTPGSQVIKRVAYTGGECVVRVTLAARGACNAQAGYVPIPQPEVEDVRAPLRVFLTPDKQAFRVRFRARQAVLDGRSTYTIEVRPVGGHGFITHSYSRNVAAGGLVRTTVGLYNHRRGRYRIVVRYRTVQAHPGPTGSPAYPGLLVGQVRINVP